MIPDKDCGPHTSTAPATVAKFGFHSVLDLASDAAATVQPTSSICSAASSKGCKFDLLKPTAAKS